MSKMLQIADLLEKLNSLWDANSEHIEKASESLKKLNSTASILPSTYSEALKGAAKSQEAITQSAKAMKDASSTVAGYTDNYKKLVQARDAALKKLEDIIAKEYKSTKEINKARAAYEALAEKVKTVYETVNNVKEKATQKAIELAEKERIAEEKKFNKQVEMAEKAYQRELAARQKLEAKDSRLGASSPIPGMSAKISDLKNTERAILANEKLSNAYYQLTQAQNNARTSLQHLLVAEGTSPAVLRAAQKEYVELTNKVNKADKAIDSLSGNKSIGGLTTQIGSLMGAFGITTGVYLFASIIKDIYETTKQLQSLDLALKMVSGSEQEMLNNQLFIVEVAQKWGIEIKSLTSQYTQFYTASKGLLSSRDIKATFEGIAKAGSIMGLSVEKQTAAFYAFDQMMSKGIVSAEELKKQLGNAMPGAIKAAAMAYQDLHPEIKNIQEAEKGLYAAMKKGAVDSATYVPLIVANFQKLYGIERINEVNTLIAAQERLANSWTNFVRSLNDGDNTLSKLIIGTFKEWTMVMDGITSMVESDAAKRRRAMAEISTSAENSAADYLKKFKTAEEKEDYARRAVVRLQVLATESENKALAQLDIIQKIKDKIARDTEKNGKPFRADVKDLEAAKRALEKLNDVTTRRNGLIKGFKDFYAIDKTNVDEDGSGKAKRERAQLNFDWLKSEYELKKAIIERKKVDSSHDMNDENITLAKRLEARVLYSKQSMELLKLDADEAKALSLKKMMDDNARNDLALRNGDETVAKHAKNKADIHHNFTNEQLKVDEDYQRKWEELLYDNEAFSRKIEDKKLEYKKRTDKAGLEFYKNTLEEILKSKGVSDRDIIQAAQDLRDLEIADAEKTRDAALKRAGDEAELKKAIWAEYANEVAKIDKKLNDTLEANRLRRIKREKEIADIEREAKGHTTVMGENIPGYLNGVPEQYKSQYEELLRNYKIALETEDEAIIAERKRQLDEFIEYIKSMNEYLKGFFDDFVNNSGFKTLFDILGDKIKGFGDDWKTTFTAIAEMAQEFVAFMDQNSQAYFDAERARLDERYKYEIALVGDNQAAKDDIDKQYEIKKREIANREAKHKRDMVLFNIFVDTAQAVVAALPNIALSIAVGVIGGLQAAMVASRPLPAFFKGTDGAPGGLAVTDEHGAELHTDAHGRIKDFGSDGGARVKYLAPGDKIITAPKTKNILNYNDFLGSLGDILFNNNIIPHENKNNQLDTTGIIDSIHSLKHVIENKETTEEYWDERGYRKFKKINNQRIEDKNNRIRFKKG